MKRRFRLARSSDFQRVRRFGKTYAHPLIVLITLSSPEEGVRIGIVAGRSVGKAVQRNRVKRQLRAAIQPYLSKISPGWDIVLIARNSIKQATYQQIQSGLLELLQMARLLNNLHDN